MKIKKIAQSIGVVGKILNSYSTSKENTYSCEYINNLNTYSTEEQVIGTWTKEDGTQVPLYGKTIKVDVAASTNTNQSLSELGIDDTDLVILDESGSTIYYNGGGYTGLHYYLSESDYVFVYVNPNKQLNIRNQTNMARTFYITLKYTKTTD